MLNEVSDNKLSLILAGMKLLGDDTLRIQLELSGSRKELCGSLTLISSTNSVVFVTLKYVFFSVPECKELPLFYKLFNYLDFEEDSGDPWSIGSKRRIRRYSVKCYSHGDCSVPKFAESQIMTFDLGGRVTPSLEAAKDIYTFSEAQKLENIKGIFSVGDHDKFEFRGGATQQGVTMGFYAGDPMVRYR